MKKATTGLTCACGEKTIEECYKSCELSVTDGAELDVLFASAALFNDVEYTENKSFNAVRDFHQAFNHPSPDEPTAIPVETAIKRASWTMEELVEFLHASVGGNPEEFSKALTEFGNAFNEAVEKQLKEGEYTDKSDKEILVRQVDALTDISYFNYGSFVVAGVNPQPFFDIVQAANMGKLDRETGKPIIRESDGKIMKPDYWEAEFAPEPKLRAELAKQMDQ